jgi:hypothetical protein
MRRMERRRVIDIRNCVLKLLRFEYEQLAQAEVPLVEHAFLDSLFQIYVNFSWFISN